MSRLILVPQLNVPMRYQEWFATEFPKQLSVYFDDIVVLGKEELKKNKVEQKNKMMFSPINEAIQFELLQINEYLEMDVSVNDIVLLMDISFPGLFSNVFYHKRPKNLFAYCHASSLNNFDYFEQDKSSKFPVETGHSKLFNKIFVATNYHKNKLGWDNIEVIGLPRPPFQLNTNPMFKRKKYNIISVVRPCKQKITTELERLVEKRFGPIIRKECNTWQEYYEFLATGRVLLSTTKEETFGYSILEAEMNWCIPIAPNNFSFPELLPRKYLYNNGLELLKMISYFLDNDSDIPELVNIDLINSFYYNLSEKIKINLE